jgi:membrane-bound lytic murein transglycosylase F
MEIVLTHKNKIIAITSFVVMIFLLIFFIFRSCDHRTLDLEGITKSGRLRVFTDSSSLGFVVRGDSVYGFQYDVIKHFADSLGVELQVTQKNNINEGIEGLLNGEYDIIANFLPNTSELNGRVLLTNPLFNSRLMLVQKSSTDSAGKISVKNQLELANDTIYTTYKSNDVLRIKHLSNEIADTIYILEMKHASMEQLVRYVSEGKIKNTICPEQFSQKFKTKYPGIDISVPLGFTQEYSWAVHPGSKHLLNKLNDFLSDFIGSDEYWKLYRKYY